MEERTATKIFVINLITSSRKYLVYLPIENEY